MASLNAKVLSRVDTIKFGAVGALESACTDIGSVPEAELTIEMDENVATDAADLDAVVAVAYSGVKGTLKFTAQDITKANVALAMGGTVSTNDVYITPGNMAVPTYYTVYVRGAYLDGTAALWHIVKCYFKPGAGLKLGKDQQTLEMTGTLMSNPASVGTLGYSMVAIKPIAADTTPPTIASVVPLDAATAVAKAATTVVAWTFSEAIRTEDVTAGRFFVHDDTGATKAGTLSIGTNDTVVTFTPSAAWAATTKFHAVVVAGVRDTAGNALAANYITDFTTGS